MSETIKASDQVCCKCGKQAYAFFPYFDPDIPYYPYCKKCLREAQMEVWIKLSEIETEIEK